MTGIKNSTIISDIPSNWETIHSNLKKLDRNHKEYNLEIIILNTTVQIYNIFYLDKLLEYLTGEFEFIFPVPMLAPLTDPHYLNCTMMPLKMKEEAKKYLLQTKEKFRSIIPDYFQDFLTYIDLIIDFMYSEQNNQNIPDFIDFNSRWDKLRNQNLLDYAPKLNMTCSIACACR